MSFKRTTERAKHESETVVLRALSLNSPQRWGQLLVNTPLSSRTLKSALDRLEDKGQIYRQVEQTKVYPPPVLYGLSEKADKSIIPMLFAVKVRQYALGLANGSELIGENKEAVALFFKTEKEDPKERLALLVHRLGVLQLFVLLKALEERNTEWMSEISNLLEYDKDIEIALHLSNEKTRHIFFEESLEEGEKQRIIKNELKENDLLGDESIRKIGDQVFFLTSDKKSELPEKQAIRNLEDMLMQLYPEDLKKFEEFAEEASSTVKKIRESKSASVSSP
jgi:DNA-binding HxlR family transcriptional regulator